MPEFRFHITSEFENIPEACRSVKEFLAENDICEDTRINVEIILTETFNNIIEHGYGMEPGNPIDAAVEFEDNKIIMLISDKGNIRPEHSQPYKEFDPEDIANLPERGLGLMIIDRIAESTEYKSEDGTNNFTVIIKAT